jgi:hypothetical protein
MKTRYRPFQVEVRRAKNHAARQITPSKSAPAVRERPVAALGPASAPGSVLPLKPKRVLPDLRPVTRPAEQVTAKVRVTRPKAQAPRYAAMRVVEQDNETVTSGPVTIAPDASRPGGPDAALQGPASSPKSAQAAVPVRVHAEAALRFSRRSKAPSQLPRWERWKERRLPRVCWSKPKRRKG